MGITLLDRTRIYMFSCFLETVWLATASSENKSARLIVQELKTPSPPPKSCVHEIGKVGIAWRGCLLGMLLKDRVVHMDLLR